jgi:hypothetical protein
LDENGDEREHDREGEDEAQRTDGVLVPDLSRKGIDEQRHGNDPDEKRRSCCASDPTGVGRGVGRERGVGRR